MPLGGQDAHPSKFFICHLAVAILIGEATQFLKLPT